MEKKLLKKMDDILPLKKVNNASHGPIILFGYITDPPEGGGGGSGPWDPGYPTWPGTGGGGGGSGGAPSTDDGMGGTLPSGNLSSDGQEEVSTAFWALPIVSFVRFTVYPSGAIGPNVILRTRSLGNYMTKTTIPFTATMRTVDVGIYASNTQKYTFIFKRLTLMEEVAIGKQCTYNLAFFLLKILKM